MAGSIEQYSSAIRRFSGWPVDNSGETYARSARGKVLATLQTIAGYAGRAGRRLDFIVRVRTDLARLSGSTPTRCLVGLHAVATIPVSLWSGHCHLHHDLLAREIVA